MHDPPLGIGFVNGGKRWGRFSAHPRFVYIFAINRRLNQRISPKDGSVNALQHIEGPKGEKVGGSPRALRGGRGLLKTPVPLFGVQNVVLNPSCAHCFMLLKKFRNGVQSVIHRPRLPRRALGEHTVAQRYARGWAAKYSSFNWEAWTWV